MSNSESELAPRNQRPRHVLEISENIARQKLVQISELAETRPLIAVDLDDVLCQTTPCVAECALSVLTQLVTHWITHRVMQGIIAGSGRTCKSRTSIVSRISPSWTYCLNPHYRQTQFGIKYWPYFYEAFAYLISDIESRLGHNSHHYG
jgi:hypothetical protein